MNWASDSESDDETNLDTDVMQRLRVNSEQMQMEANIKNTDIAAVESKIKQEEASRLRKQQQELGSGMTVPKSVRGNDWENTSEVTSGFDEVSRKQLDRIKARTMYNIYG